MTTLLALLALVGCKVEMNYAPVCEAPEVVSITSAVVGGAPSQDRRATVKVFNSDGSCSGTIIGPHTVLTAGHCNTPKVIAVEDFGAFEVVEHFAHPGYNSAVRTDVRIVYVENELPAPFATIATDSLVCERLVVQGYGIGSDGELHERDVETVARFDEVIIATEGSCNGDSGGPLWALRADGSYVLVGVTSFGSGAPPECEGPGGYMNLLVLGDWVSEQVR